MGHYSEISCSKKKNITAILTYYGRESTDSITNIECHSMPGHCKAHSAFTIANRASTDSGVRHHPDMVAPPLTLDTLGQSQSPLNIPADGCKAVLELLVTVMLLTATGVVAAIMLVTTFGHGWDTYVELELEQTGLIMVTIILIAPEYRFF